VCRTLNLPLLCSLWVYWDVSYIFPDRQSRCWDCNTMVLRWLRW
jgi:hypothetical protein